VRKCASRSDDNKKSPASPYLPSCWLAALLTCFHVLPLFDVVMLLGLGQILVEAS
jgi:hypothetical protein